MQNNCETTYKKYKDIIIDNISILFIIVMLINNN